MRCFGFRPIRIFLAALAAMILLAGCVQTPVTTSKPSDADKGKSSSASSPSPAKLEPPPAPSRQLPPKAAIAQYRHSPAPPPRKGDGGVMAPPPPLPLPADREVYQEIDANPVKRVAEHPVSTFSIDVDTGSYANMRRFLRKGRMPPKDAMRVEEMINYFSYDYPAPKDKSAPFMASVEVSRTPWNSKTALLRIGIKGYEVKSAQRPAANLVFLLDVSGSMRSEDKLPLLKKGFGLLVEQLTAKDRISIVVYAGAAGVILEPTPGDQKAVILAAMNKLQAGGSTAGGQGVQLAYAMARQAFIKDGINRIMLATDGDFNVGMTNFRALKDMVERERKSGVSLTTLGFGQGNYNERLMEQLADAGNGNYAYIDNLNEANKVLVQEVSSTLFTIAGDVKIQIEFNPAVVSEYRLIGYENRMLKREDFKNDQVDAGDIGAGHSVTALYELALTGKGGNLIEPLRYQKRQESGGAPAKEMAFLRLRYKLPGQDKSRLMEIPLARELTEAGKEPSADFKWAAAVAGFGQLLRGGKYAGDFSYNDVLSLARSGRGEDPFGYRGEFITLVGLAKSLDKK
jgi:Ca-activated chloride channel family protein